ncbi:ATP-dependent nuclease [Nocardia vinacea]|uniref:ATP-dependent nuclease n=1 Tax=Nocardia vinacea TaxID=96468 RepID=UPI0002EB8F24|nr:ATP-binding protein [Nocardia vinacea]
MKYYQAVTTGGFELYLDGLTVLVGPNNSGKSTTLRDIRKIITAEFSGTTLHSIAELRAIYSPDSLYQSMITDRMKYSRNGVMYGGLGVDLNSRFEFGCDDGSLRNWASKAELGKVTAVPNAIGYSQNFGRFHVAHLTAGTRLDLANSCVSIDLQDDSANPSLLLQWLLPRHDILDALKSAFYETFGMRIELDHHGLAKLRLRIAEDFGDSPTSINEAGKYYKQFPELEQQGDGMRSFVGVVLGLLLADDRLILLDEPEAFLHPEQARRLGRWVARNAINQPEQQTIISTHNAHFLQGLISGNAMVKIMRLHREGTGPTRFVPMGQDTVNKLAKDPLLSSQRVIESIFHNHTVICESDSDRTIYQAVAAKVFENTDTFFVNAQNKQTCGRIARVLRDAGMKPRTVVDIDIIRDAVDLKKLMQDYAVPDTVQNEIQGLRSAVATSIGDATEDEEIVSRRSAELLKLAREAGDLSKNQIRSRVDEILSYGKWSPIKKTGIDALEGPVRAVLQTLLDHLAEFGINVVPVGELESWMEISAAKNRWIEPALEMIYNGQCGEPLEHFVKTLLTQVPPGPSHLNRPNHADHVSS